MINLTAFDFSLEHSRLALGINNNLLYTNISGVRCFCLCSMLEFSSGF